MLSPSSYSSSSRHNGLVLSTLALALSTLFTASAISAEPHYTAEEPVVVTATRIEQPLSDAAASIAVITQKEIEETAPQTLTDVLLEIPNVDVTDSESVMFSRVSIRGSDANQITYLVDGMRQDDTTTGGNQFIGIFSDPEMLKQVEVRRGGGSALYGNGGIGGVLAVTTKDASDFLGDSDKNFGARIKTGYATETKSWQKGAYLYGRHGIWDAVFGINRRDSGETRTSRGRRSNNDADGDYTSVMAKVTALPTNESAVSLSYNYDVANDEWMSTDLQSYKNEQHRITGKWDYSGGELLNLTGGIQYVKSEYSFDTGMARAENDFDSVGSNIQNTMEFTALGNHALTFGGDIYRKSQKGKDYDGGQWIDSTSRPDADALDAGLFIQDEYAFNQYVSVTPVLRWNYYRRESNNGYPSVSDNKLTPGITLNVTPVDSLRLWASVHSGYRPPVMDELYFTMVYPGIIDTAVVIANPDLKPERSTNYEIGSSINICNAFTEDDRLSGRIALFYDDVKDFISSTSWWDSSDFSIWYFTAENIGHVIRKGVEFSGSYQVGDFSASVNYGLVHATDKETDERVPGVTPQSANLKLGYEIPSQDLNLWYRLHWSKGGKSSQEIGYTGVYADYGSYATHALGFDWSPEIPGFGEIQAGLAAVNLFDKGYRMLNGSYGYGRGVRVWLAAQF